MQLLMNWAMGRDAFRIDAVRPLRSVLFGDENDEGDMAMMYQGLVRHLQPSRAEKDLLQDNLVFYNCPSLSGEDFLRHIERWLIAHPCDLAVIDPLVSFAGVDLTQQHEAAKFLRVGLSAIAARTGVCWIVVHHTPKHGSQKEGKRTWLDDQHSGAGSYDLAGWARAVFTLQQADDLNYRLVFSKRYKLAGTCHPDGTPAQVLWLRQGNDGQIYWQQMDPPQEPEPEDTRGGATPGKPSQVNQIAAMNLHSFCRACTDEGEGINSIGKRLMAWLAKDNLDYSMATCKRAIPALVANRKLCKGEDGLYRKGKEA